MNIIEKKVAELKPYGKNPRLNDDAVKYVAESISQFGFKVPIVIDKDNNIVCGHTRWKACKKLKIDTVPCVVADDLTEEQIRAFRIADNKVSEKAEWDLSLLDTELAEIETIDMTLLGFDEKEPAPIEVQEDDFDEEPPVEPIAKYGDLYQLGNHRLMCGDSTNTNDVECLMGGYIADILVTSPPYNVGEGASLRQHYEKGQEKIKSLYNEYNDAVNWFELMHESTENAKMVTNAQFINVQMLGNNKNDFVTWLYENKDNLVDLIVWNKHTCPPQMHENILNNAFEFVVCLDNDSSTRIIRYGNFKGTISNLMETKREQNKYSDVHKAVYSVEFVGKILNINSLCKSVLDLFGGTGTTMIACEQMGKQCFMMEMSPQYIDLIIDRWEKLTGKKVELIGNYGNGKTESEP